MNLRKRLNKKKKSKDFPCGICENVSQTKSAKQLHEKTNHNKKTIQYTLNPINWQVGYTWLACNSCNIKTCTENELKVNTNTVHASVKKIIPKETP